MDQTTQQPDIFTRLGMASASEEDKQKLAEQLTDLTMVRVLAKLSERLSDEQAAEIDRLIDEGKSDQVEDRLRAVAPEFDQLVEQTAREVGDQLVDDHRKVMQMAREQASKN